MSSRRCMVKGALSFVLGKAVQCSGAGLQLCRPPVYYEPYQWGWFGFLPVGLLQGSAAVGQHQQHWGLGCAQCHGECTCASLGESFWTSFQGLGFGGILCAAGQAGAWLCENILHATANTHLRAVDGCCLGGRAFGQHVGTGGFLLLSQ